ncbi:MAG: hypothetical protein ACLFTR_04930 [Candidatus Woesearchaeota archaeon]
MGRIKKIKGKKLGKKYRFNMEPISVLTKKGTDFYALSLDYRNLSKEVEDATGYKLCGIVINKGHIESVYIDKDNPLK